MPSVFDDLSDSELLTLYGEDGRGHAMGYTVEAFSEEHDEQTTFGVFPSHEAATEFMLAQKFIKGEIAREVRWQVRPLFLVSMPCFREVKNKRMKKLFRRG